MTEPADPDPTPEAAMPDDQLTVIDTLTTAELAAALRAGAEGDHASQAAAELLIRHGDPFGRGWLDRADFRACLDLFPSFSDPEVLMAGVDWDRVRDLAGASSALDILTVARALVGEDLDQPLSLSGLDDTNRHLVLRAVLHAAAGPAAAPLVVRPFQENDDAGR